MDRHGRTPAQAVPMTPAYRAVMIVGTPIMRWSRLTVSGLEALPTSGPTLVVANHDSYWDPIAIAVAARPRRQIRALAKSTLWKVGVIGRLMDSMGHIPIERGSTNEAAVDTARAALAAGACIGVFPEGTRSLGTPLRARSGAGRLAIAVPDATIVCARVTGATDVVRLPKRPTIAVEFFRPEGGGVHDGEDASALMHRLLHEIRRTAPCSIPGRRRTAAKFALRAGAAATTQEMDTR
ncbi:MAG TPA: lysophospholipid acyltransferase family protein [Jatrophihabitantaceae bacterium]|nr:lysophospholipid acyltransferase family protein [Jatrophihabitantaceae bacterium]